MVEQPAVQLMQHELGWEVANCYDEWSGGVSVLGRDGKREVVLTGRLKPALRRLNLDLPVEANREIDKLLKPGVNVREEFNKNLRSYKQTIPQLFHYNALLLVSNGVQSRPE